MTITAIFVVYAVVWFMCLFIALPIRVTTQADTGKVTPGTAPSAPVDPMMRVKIRWVTIVATVIWAVIVVVIEGEFLTIANLDLFGVM